MEAIYDEESNVWYSSKTAAVILKKNLIIISLPYDLARL